MKKRLVFAFTMFLGAGLAFAQATGGSPGKQDTPGPGGPGRKGNATSGKKATKARKGHKGKDSTGGTTTQPPK